MSRLKSLTIIPMGKGEEPEPKKEEEVDEDGMRDSFDEFADAVGIGEDVRDSAFEALKGLIEQCCAKMDY